MQESASVSDSDSDADCHAVARGIPPDVLVDSILNGLCRYLHRAFWLQAIHYLALLVFLMTFCVSLTTIYTVLVIYGASEIH